MEKTIGKIDHKAVKHSRKDFLRLGISILFMIVVLIFTFIQNGGISDVTFLAVASVVGGYMAMNIGANDVANNVGPAVGSKALTMSGAILIAMIFEAMGSLLAGGDVVSTIKDGIIDPKLFTDSRIFVWAMLAALLGGAIWLNIATAIKAPVSTTHSIVGGVVGSGIASAGLDIVNWSKMVTITSSWIISPILGAISAAILLYFIKVTIFHKEDMVKASQKILPILIAIMSFSFSVYLAIKGIKNIIDVGLIASIIIGTLFGILTYLTVKPILLKSSIKISNTRESINSLFTIPLIFAAALLSFAHGANDVANAIGPLAAINDVLMNGVISSKSSIPIWIMLIGALGIVIGLAMYGPKLIKTVGSEITELDQARAFSVAISSAIVVIVASWLGLPVSSTHIAIGGIFGVGFLRIYIDGKYQDKINGIINSRIISINEEIEILESSLNSNEISEDEKKRIQKLVTFKKDELLKTTSGIVNLSKKEKKNIKKIEKEKYIKREMLIKIIAAWIITVPASAFLSAFLFYTIKGFML